MDKQDVKTPGAPGALESVRAMTSNGIRWLTIVQIARLTGLTSTYIRRRTQEDKWSKDYDERGRVIIPIDEIEEYLQAKADREGKAYIIRLTDEMYQTLLRTFEGEDGNLPFSIEPRYNPAKAKAYRLRKAEAASRNGVKRGKLNL